MFHVMLCSSLRSCNHGNPMRQEYVASLCYVMFQVHIYVCYAQVHLIFQVHVQIMHVHVHVMF